MSLSRSNVRWKRGQWGINPEWKWNERDGERTLLTRAGETAQAILGEQGNAGNDGISECWRVTQKIVSIGRGT